MDPDSRPADHALIISQACQEVRAALREQHPDADLARLDRAFALGEQAHEGQWRRDGQPYITHPLAVAKSVAELGMDEDGVIAAVLHDVLEDTSVTADDLRNLFGSDVLELVQGVTKLEEERTGGTARQVAAAKTKRGAETIRKMLLAMAKDFRVMGIKLADRLHNMTTLDAMPPDKRTRIATETLDIYAPIAARLGIWQIKWQLEDLSFKALHPTEFARISELVGATRRQREEMLKEVIRRLRQGCEERGVKVVDIQGRPKHLFSIFNKMIQQKLRFEEIHDLLALRIIVEDRNDCYVALGVVNASFAPIQSMYYDYIAHPKPNGYQSLHTKVIGPEAQTIEIQIRTWSMHQVAEFGVAAHWSYKEGRDAGDEGKRLARLREQLMELSRDNAESGDFMRSASTDVFSEQIFVSTPKGDTIEMPAGSTPIDFAFRVHTQLGLTLIGARVNGVMVPLSTELHSRDVVELITRSNATPSRDWIEHAKSSHTRSKLKAYFRKLDREQDSQRGRELLERELGRLGLDPRAYLGDEKLREAAKHFDSVDSPADFLARISTGLISVQNAVAKLRGVVPDVPSPDRLDIKSSRETEVRSPYENVSGVMASRAKCCSPIPGDECVGYVSRGRGIIIHRRVCPNAVAFLSTEPERLVPYEFRPDGGVYSVAQKIICVDRPGLIADVSSIFGEARANVSALKVLTIQQQTAEIDVTIDVTDAQHLQHIMTKVSNLTDVLSIRRLFGKVGK